MSTIWLVMIAIGVLTFATRLSFIALLEKWDMPVVVRRALHYVPVAVLSAIILPELAFYEGSLELSPLNPRLVAGLFAIVVAWKTKNILWTIVVGMAVLLLLKSWF